MCGFPGRPRAAARTPGRTPLQRANAGPTPLQRANAGPTPLQRANVGAAAETHHAPQLRTVLHDDIRALSAAQSRADDMRALSAANSTIGA